MAFYDAPRTINRIAIDFTELDKYVSQEQAFRILTENGIHPVFSKHGGVALMSHDVVIEAAEAAKRNNRQLQYKRGAKVRQWPSVPGVKSYLDCSSFAKWCYARSGIQIPRRTIQQRGFPGATRISEEHLEPGCLLFKTGTKNHYELDLNDGVGHVGIYAGEGMVLHAINQQYPIVRTRLSEFLGNEDTFRGMVKIIQNPGRTFTFEFEDDLEIETSDDVKWVLLRSI